MLLNYSLGNLLYADSHTITNRKIVQKLPFYITSFGHYRCDSAYYTERQDYPQCLLIYTAEGEGQIKYKEETLPIPKNCLVVIDCRQYQYYKCPQDEWEFYWIHFSGKCAFGFTEIINEEGAALVDISNHMDFTDLYAELIRIFQSADLNTELNASNLMNRLLSQIITLQQNQSFPPGYLSHKADIQRSIAYIRENYRSPITVEDLAAVSRISKFYYIRIFRSLIGDTPYNFLNLYRINQSKKLLVETNQSVSEIAAAVGFPNVKNYIACFKKFTMTTPLKFRQHNIF